VIARNNYNPDVNYSAPQQLAHHASFGPVPLNAGDLLGSGRFRAQIKDARAACLKLSWGGAGTNSPERRLYPQLLWRDGDTMILTGHAAGDATAIGFWRMPPHHPPPPNPGIKTRFILPCKTPPSILCLGPHGRTINEAYSHQPPPLPAVRTTSGGA